MENRRVNYCVKEQVDDVFEAIINDKNVIAVTTERSGDTQDMEISNSHEVFMLDGFTISEDIAEKNLHFSKPPVFMEHAGEISWGTSFLMYNSEGWSYVYQEFHASSASQE